MHSKSLLSLVALTVLLAAGAAEAQTPRFGIKGGLVRADIKSDVDPDAPFDPVRAYGGGLTAELPLRGGVSLQVEALYLRRETKSTFGIVESRTRVNYVELPVMLKVYGGDPRDSYRLYLLAGGAVAYRLSAQSLTVIGGEISTTDDAKDQIKDFNIGVPVALGVSFGRFDLEARYTLGLTTFDESGTGGLKWRTWSFMGAVNF